VRELLLAGRRPVREILLATGLDAAAILDDIVDLADETRTPIREIARSKFDVEARTEGSQGIIARAAPIEEVELDEVLSPPPGMVPFLLALDGVTDPGNVGALLRTAECAGVTGVVFPRHRAAHITPTVTKTAQGAIEHLPMTIVGGLPAALSQMVSAGIWTVGLDGAADQNLFDLDLGGEPVCLVVGAEGKGLSRLVRERVDVAAALPLKGVVGSLNVSAAGAIAMYEVSRHR
jgi:23S rRNA (guanosine2251-2'-O)-methyltransferase